MLSTRAIFQAVSDHATTTHWTTGAYAEGETMSAYTPDGSPLILLLVTIAVIGLAVWAVSMFFPAKRNK